MQRDCVRCGLPFFPADIDQMCCSDVCSTRLQGGSLVRLSPPMTPVRELVTVPKQKVGRRGPIFQGQRFVVFEWQVEQLARLLGPLLDDFDLYEWFFTLDARVAKSPEIIPQRDGGVWLQAQTLAEAHRRGMPVADGTVEAPRSSSASNLRTAWERFFAGRKPS